MHPTQQNRSSGILYLLSAPQWYEYTLEDKESVERNTYLIIAGRRIT